MLLYLDNTRHRMEWPIYPKEVQAREALFLTARTALSKAPPLWKILNTDSYRRVKETMNECSNGGEHTAE